MKRITHILCFIALCLSWTACTKDEAVEPQQLPAPVVRLVERPGTEALLEWADVSGAMSYCYYLTDGGGGEVIAETGTAETSVRLAGLEESKTYVFFVKAVGGDGYTDSEYAQCMVETMHVEVLSIASDRAVIEIVPTVSTEIYCWAMIPALQADGLDDDALISLLQQSHGVELTDLWSMGSKTHVCAGLEPSTEYTLAVFMWSPTLEQPASGIVRRHITTLDKQISFTRAVEHYLGPAEDGMHDVYRIMLFNEGVEEQDGSLSGDGVAICLDVIAPVQQSTLIPPHLYTVAGRDEITDWSVLAGDSETPQSPSNIMHLDMEEAGICTPVASGIVNVDRNDRIYTISGDLQDKDEGNYSFTFKGSMEKVYDPLEFGDGISDGPLVGIRYLIEDGANFGVSGSAMLEFFFYPNEHVHTYKYMLLNDASVFETQSEDAWKEELLGGSEGDGYYTGTDANREYYTSELNQKAMLLALGISEDGVPGALTYVKTGGVIGEAGNAGVIENGIGPWVDFVNPAYLQSTLTVSLQPSIRALYNFSCIFLGNPIGDGTYTEVEVSRLLAEGSLSDGVYSDLTEMSHSAEPGEVVTFAVLGTNLDRIPGQLNWIALKAPESGFSPIVVDQSSNTGTETPVGRASLSVSYSVYDAGTIPGYEQYETFPAVIYEFTPNVYCVDYRWQGGFPVGEFEHNKASLEEYFASVYNSASYRAGGWYGRSSTDNDVQILIYNPATLGLSMDVYFIGYNTLGEAGDPDYIQVDIPTELPSAPSSVRAAAGACAPGVHELFSFVELPEPAPEHHPLPQTMSDRPDGAAIELRQPVR